MQNPSPAERLQYVLSAKFAGSQSAMAKAIGCSQSYISRVLAGHTAGGPKLLRALTKVPGINSHWALTGEGKPFPTATQSLLPLAKQLLDGPPANADQLTGRFEAVSPHLAKPTSYVYELAESWNEEHAIQGDRLVLDGDSQKWLPRPELLDGKLCAVRCALPDGISVILSRVRYRRDSSGKHALHLESNHECERENTHPTTGKLPRGIQMPGSSDEFVAVNESGYGALIAPADVVAVAVALLRDL